MKERGILFSADMVRALLDGRKTQTRRIVNVSRIKPSRWTSETIGRIAVDGAGFRAKTTTYNIWSNLFVCPYGVAGDRLWVRETFALHDRSEPPIVYYRADDTAKYESDGRWKPSIFMPRKFSRITLEINGVRVERVQDISEEDALAEGITATHTRSWRAAKAGLEASITVATAIENYAYVWNLLHGKGAWEQNPWVWVISFRMNTGG